MSNTFNEDNADFYSQDTKNVAHPSAAELVLSHHERGRIRYQEFLAGMEKEEPSLYDPIKKGKTSSDKNHHQLSQLNRMSWKMIASCSQNTLYHAKTGNVISNNYSAMKTSHSQLPWAKVECYIHARSLSLLTYFKTMLPPLLRSRLLMLLLMVQNSPSNFQNVW